MEYQVNKSEQPDSNLSQHSDNLNLSSVQQNLALDNAR